MAFAELVSENLTSIVLFALTFAIGLLISNRNQRKKYKIPAGPPAIPFFGNALSLKDNDEGLNQFNDFSKQYGSVYSLYLGRKHVVIVNGWERIKEVTVDKGLDFGDRCTSVPAKAVNPKRIGILANSHHPTLAIPQLTVRLHTEYLLCSYI